MAKRGQLLLTLCILGLGVFTVGCSQGLGIHRRESMRADEQSVAAAIDGTENIELVRAAKNGVLVPVPATTNIYPSSGMSAGVRIIEAPPADSSGQNSMPAPSMRGVSSESEAASPVGGASTKQQSGLPVRPKLLSPPPLEDVPARPERIAPPNPMSPPVPTVVPTQPERTSMSQPVPVAAPTQPERVAAPKPVSMPVPTVVPMQIESRPMSQPAPMVVSTQPERVASPKPISPAIPMVVPTQPAPKAVSQPLPFSVPAQPERVAAPMSVSMPVPTVVPTQPEVNAASQRASIFVPAEPEWDAAPMPVSMPVPTQPEVKAVLRPVPTVVSAQPERVAAANPVSSPATSIVLAQAERIAAPSPVSPQAVTPVATQADPVAAPNSVSQPAPTAVPAQAEPTAPPKAVTQPAPTVVPAQAQPAAPPKAISPAPPAVAPKQPETIATPKPILPPVPTAVARPDLPMATPRPLNAPANNGLISLHADDLDVRKALEMISRQAKINILVSSSVTGTVTLDLRDKTLEEVLDAIVKLCHLTVRRDKDVLYVSTAEELRKGEEDDLPVRVYHLNYVKSGDVEKMIKPLLTAGKGVMTASPESEMGIKADIDKAGGNSMAGGEMVVVQDYEQVLKTIDRVIAQIDLQPVQVLIEAVIVQVTLTKDMELGINYAILDGAGKTLGVVGDGLAVNAAAGFAPATVLTTAGKMTAGFADGSNGIKFGWSGGPTSAFIKALETFGETKVLACPRLLVVNKQHAEIQLGDRLGYQTTTQTQTSTVQTVNFIDVGTLLRLRPFVSSDGVIRLEIHPERSSGELNLQGVPQTHNAQVTSNVMIPNGCTVVIGGLIDNDIEEKWEGLPYLSRLPVIGNAFRHTVKTALKKEMVVILTPHIWQPNCPDALNYLGRPRTLGLDERVSQTNVQEKRDGGSCYELVRPEPCPTGVPMLPAAEPMPQQP